MVVWRVQLFVPGLYLPPVFRGIPVMPATPDNHFTAGPHCCVIISGLGRVGEAGSCPTIGTGLVSAAGINIGRDFMPPQTIISLPVHTAVS